MDMGRASRGKLSMDQLWTLLERKKFIKIFFEKKKLELEEKEKEVTFFAVQESTDKTRVFL